MIQSNGITEDREKLGKCTVQRQQLDHFWSSTSIYPFIKIIKPQFISPVNQRDYKDISR